MAIRYRDKPGTSSFQQNIIQGTCHTHPILLVSTIMDFSTPNLKATVISTFVVQKFALKIHIVIEKTMLKKCGAQFCGILACIREILFN